MENYTAERIKTATPGNLLVTITFQIYYYTPYISHRMWSFNAQNGQAEAEAKAD